MAFDCLSQKAEITQVSSFYFTPAIRFLAFVLFPMDDRNGEKRKKGGGTKSGDQLKVKKGETRRKRRSETE